MKTETLLADASFLYAALDGVQTNIFIADGDFNLIYMNPKAEQTLKSIELELMDAFEVRVEDFIGGSIHRFHKSPRQVKKILRNPLALPHDAKFDFGGVRLKTIVNGITSGDGETIGYIVNWKDVSEKIRVREEMVNIFEEFKSIEDGYAGKKK